MHPVYYDMSEAELIVCDFLKTMRVYWIYEQPVFLADNMERPRLSVQIAPPSDVK